MISLQKDDNWEMRRGSARMLGKLGPDAKDAIPALTEALNAPSKAVRTKAPESLRNIKGNEGELRKPNSAESAFKEKEDCAPTSYQLDPGGAKYLERICESKVIPLVQICEGDD